MTTKPHQRLFIPGPTDVLPDVLDSQTAPMIGHRSAEFEALFARVQDKLRRMFETDQRVFVVASSGSGMIEGAIRNAVKNRVLCVVNGAFGQRWREVAEGCAKTPIALQSEWGYAVKPNEVADALQIALETGPVDAVTIVHNETSTGVLNPVADIAEAVREVSLETLVIVDAVSSFGGTRTPFDEWNLDICLASSQKALALPPGLALCAVRDVVLTRAKEIEGRGWYFDFLNLEESLVRHTTPATPAISLLRALDLQTDHILQEGLEARFLRHEVLGEMVREWATREGFALGAEDGYRSPTVTAVINTRGLDIQEVNGFLAKRDMMISNGYGPFKDKAFRIAHMGEGDVSDINRLLNALDEYISLSGG